MRGRKPDPARLKQLRGSRRQTPADHVSRLDLALKAPEHLSDSAKRIWTTTYGELVKHELMTRLDLDTLEAYSVAVANLRLAQSEVDQHGVVIDAPQGRKRNPALGVVAECARAIAALGSSLGLNPTARLRLGHVEPKPTGGDFDDIDR